LDLLLLKIVALQPLHGWAIAQRLKQVSGDVLQVSEGSLYPALHKLELDPERDEALLGAVVDVAFNASALAISGFDDARPRRSQIVELGQRFGAEPFVVDRQT